MKLLTYLWNYFQLSRDLYSLHKLYENNISFNTDQGCILIDSIKTRVEFCGSICIKFCQWLLPILDTIYIKDNENPYWFVSLEGLYEDCPIHSIEYSKEVFLP